MLSEIDIIGRTEDGRWAGNWGEDELLTMLYNKGILVFNR